MIGKLTGRVDEIGDDFVILDVNGVGYVAMCAGPTLEKLPARGEHASLVIETHVREDAIRLFGFATSDERDWFRLLQTVQGVGAKVALAVLSVCPPVDLARAIALGDKSTVGRASGVGPKLAARIVSELKEKVPAISIVAPALERKGQVGRGPQGPVAEAVSALVNLGYPHLQAADAVSSAMSEHGLDAPLSTLIRAGLKELAR
jgi:holliday junction DNA helicase RuvA